MNCPTCKTKMEKGTTDLTFRRDRSVVIIEEVPAMVCPQCEESSLDAQVSRKAYEIAQEEIERGVALEFLKYKVA